MGFGFPKEWRDALVEAEPSPALDAGSPDLPADVPPPPPDAIDPCPAATAGTLGAPCGACTGKILCSGACSIPIALLVNGVDLLDKTGARSSPSGDLFGRDCPVGHVSGALHRQRHVLPRRRPRARDLRSPGRIAQLPLSGPLVRRPGHHPPLHHQHAHPPPLRPVIRGRRARIRKVT